MCSIRNCTGARTEPDFPTSAAAAMQTWPNLGYSKASNGGDARHRKGRENMSSFEKISAMSEALGKKG